MKILIISTARNENNYINEWIDWHLNLGFDNIIIADDADQEEPKVSDVVNNEKVIIKKRLSDQTQIHIYNELFESYWFQYDWIFFIDIDEFINIDKSKFTTIKDFLNQQQVKDRSMLKLAWKFYGDNEYIKVDSNNYSILKRFKNPSQIITWNQVHYKSAYNTKKINPILFNNINFYPHDISISLPLNECINSKYEEIGHNPSDSNHKLINKVYDNCWINHYFTKTISEFLDRKLYLQGGHMCRTDKNKFKYLDNKTAIKLLDDESSYIFKYGSHIKFCELYYCIMEFFKYNKITSKKIEFIEDYMKSHNMNSLNDIPFLKT